MIDLSTYPCPFGDFGKKFDRDVFATLEMLDLCKRLGVSAEEIQEVKLEIEELCAYLEPTKDQKMVGTPWPQIEPALMMVKKVNDKVRIIKNKALFKGYTPK